MTELLFAIAAFGSHFVQGITGFGGTVLAMPFVIHLVDPHVAVPVFVMLSLLFSASLAMMDRKKIVWREVLMIATHMMLGAPLGILFFKYLPVAIYKPIMGALFVLIALWGLLRLVSPKAASVDLGTWVRRVFLVVGGITQGAFGSSGPFIVFYAENALKEKSEFRTTMNAMWAVTNVLFLPQYLWAGVDTTVVLRLTGCSLPAIFLGLVMGMLVHKKIEQKRFSLLIYTVLLISGLFNLIY